MRTTRHAPTVTPVEVLRQHERLTLLLLLVLLLSTSLACAPGMWNQPAPQIGASWQCPTPSPLPTEVIGYQPTTPPLDASATADPNVTSEPIYGTPRPTATPYVRTGSDYYLGQRVQVSIGTGTLLVTVKGYTRRDTANASEQYHLIRLEIDNQTRSDLPILFDLSTLRNIKRPDGRTLQQSWTHSRIAATTAGISPASDPPLKSSGSAITGGYPRGISQRTLVFQAPAGEAQTWGITVDDRSPTHRDGGGGSGQVWVILRQDTACTEPGSGALDGSPVPPAGTPLQGSGRWPVVLDAPITRGYGCHSFYTGTRGSSCPASAPWWHDGIDFAAPVGSPLFATRAMTIQFAGRDPSTMDCSFLNPANDPPYFGFGNYVKTSDAQGYVYWYGHVNAWRVSSGQQVSAGSQIANMGKTGCSTGSHLHFRVRLNGIDRNPLEVISK